MPDITIQPPPNPEGQAKLILATNGMGLITPIFFKLDEQNLAIEQGQTPDQYNWMGLPVFDTLQIDELHYTRNDGQKIGIDKMVIPTVMHVVNIPKNVIKTPIAGGDGTIKEYIGLGDHEITLSGRIVGRNANVPPDLEIKQLVDFCKAPVPLQVYSNFLAHFEVFSIVITDSPTFSQVEGTRNCIDFTITCCSDKPFEVEFNSNKNSVASSNSVQSGVGSFLL